MNHEFLNQSTWFSMALPYFTTGPAKFDCFTREERGYVGWGMACDSYGAHALDVLKDYQRSVIHQLFHGMITHFLFGNVWKTREHRLGETGMLVCRRLYIYIWLYFMWVVKSQKIQNLHCDSATCYRGRVINPGFMGPYTRMPSKWSFHMNNEKRAPGCLGYIGDGKLPSYMGITINHYKDPVIKPPGFNGKYPRFFAWLIWKDSSPWHTFILSDKTPWLVIAADGKTFAPLVRYANKNIYDIVMYI